MEEHRPACKPDTSVTSGPDEATVGPWATAIVGKRAKVPVRPPIIIVYKNA